ncbi:histidine phosphatase family protein [Methylobacterium durans]|uniref:SixA phosphatase family protein n=1 Tax=Methylobacterium durans TaxID=2202825 RepID=UPI002B0020FC|nr:histidine phosphatase family protein [Methylobacterium durans]MEA1830822.1 histidine phosphatase family protein [Methylobacterium durans]
MRRLILLRHAKSDRAPGLRDLDRPLNPRGRQAAPFMGRYLADQGLRPDLALVSPSVRTQETWEAAAAALGTVRTETVRTIYEAPASALLAAVRDAPDEAGSLILVGHNPGMQDLAVKLVGRGDAAARGRLRTQFPTAAVAVIDFEAGAWSEIGWGAGTLERFVRPRELAADLDE